MKHARILILIALTGLTLWSNWGCRRGAPPESSHARMLRELADIKDRAAVEDEYFEDAGVRLAIMEVNALPDGGSHADHLELNWKIGVDYLRLGRNDDAIKHLTLAYDVYSAASELMSPAQQELFLLDIAVAHLRAGETENCINCWNGDRCILPIKSQGIHEQPDGSRQATRFLTELLGKNPDHMTAAWLLNIAAMTLGEYPDAVPQRYRVPADAFASKSDFPRFHDVAAKLGLKVVDCSGGVIADDFDGDGLLDLMNSTWHRGGQLRLFRNQGDGTWSERTEQAGLTGIYGGLNMVQADYDNDGDIDVYVLRGAWLNGKWAEHPNSLLQNDGAGNFQDVTYAVGLGVRHYPTQTAAWADFDNDGDLDLYVGNEKAPSQLFENRAGQFHDIAAQAGVLNNLFAKGVVWGDYDNDRYPDLYVSNLGQDNRLYHNNHDGTFTDVAKQLNVTRPNDSFPVWFWDFNNDGALDLYAPSYEIGVRHVAADYLGHFREDARDCLYQGDGRGGFRDVADEVGLTRTTQPMGCNFGDLDNDGFLDFSLGTGYTDFWGLMPNLTFKNDGGRKFIEVTMEGGFGHLQKGHGVAFFDWDQDGDQDVFHQMGGANPGDAFGNVLFENPGFGNHWLVVRLVGKTSNRSAIGARIRVDIEENGSMRSIHRRVGSGGSFGANPLRQFLGLGQASRIVGLSVYWPTSDQARRYEDVPLDGFVEIHEGEKAFRVRPYQPLQPGPQANQEASQ